MGTTRRNVATVSATSLGGKVAGVALVIPLAGALGSSDFGAYSIGLSTAALIMSIGSLNLGPVVAKTVAQANSEDHESKAVSTASVLVTGGLTLVVPISLLLVSLTNAGGPALHTSSAMLGMTLVGICSAYSLVLAFVAQGKGDFGTYSILLASRAVMPTGLALLASLASPSVGSALLGQGAGELVALSIAVFRLRRMLGRPDAASLRIGGRDSVWTAAGAIVTNLALWLVPVLIQRQLGLSAVANYALAQRLYAGISVVLNSTVTTSAPEVYREARLKVGDKWAAPRVLRRIGYATFATVLMLAATAASLSPFVPADYGQVPLVLAALTVSAVGYAANGTINYIALGRGEIRAWVASDLILSLTLIGLTSALMALMGVAGAAVAQGLAFLISAAALAFILAVTDKGRSQRDAAGSLNESE